MSRSAAIAWAVCRGLHLGGRWQREHVHDVARLARLALNVLADLIQRDDGDEEESEEPPSGAMPVGPVTAALAAVEDTLANGAVENPQAPDDEQGSSLS